MLRKKGRLTATTEQTKKNYMYVSVTHHIYNRCSICNLGFVHELSDLLANKFYNKAVVIFFIVLCFL